MAPGGVHAGYKNSLYVYAAEKNPTSEDSFEEWLVELTTGLELALEGNTEDADDLPEEHKEAYSSRKKDWEEVLEQATVAEVMLRQALENGLGQQEEEEKNRQKQNEEESDNDFSLEGAVMPAEGTNRNRTETTEFAGNSQSLRTDTGNHAEHLNLANGEKNKGEKVPLRVFCLTCETQCERKNKGR